MKKTIYNSILLIAVAILFAGCTSKLFPKNSVQNPTPEPMVQETQNQPAFDLNTDIPAEEISYIYVADKDGQTVIELLEEKAEVVSESSSVGVMVKGINGIMSTTANYWAFYVNANLSMTGADSTILKQGDIVEWRFEKL